MSESIPPITNPLGRHWKQPPRSNIVIDEKNAYMDVTTFKALPEYSCTFPGGVYPGKMWKRHDGAHDRHCKPEDRKWLLCWYGECADKTLCSTNFRTILLVPTCMSN